MSDALRELQLGFARSHGIPDGLADRITGESVEEIEASASALAEEIKSNANPSELVALAGSDFNKAEQTQRLVESLHGDPAAEELSEFTGFDGGVREPAPLPTDPVKEHDEVLLEWLQNTPPGGGGEW